MGHPIVVRRFLIVGHRASTDPAFSLDDLAGAAGRMDILLNAANAALLLAHDLRRDVEVGLLLLGPPDPPRFGRLKGFRRRSYQPDIRSNATFVLSDNQDLTTAEEQALTDRGALVVGLGPLALHTDHALAIVQNQLDRR